MGIKHLKRDWCEGKTEFQILVNLNVVMELESTVLECTVVADAQAHHSIWPSAAVVHSSTPMSLVPNPNPNPNPLVCLQWGCEFRAATPERTELWWRADVARGYLQQWRTEVRGELVQPSCPPQPPWEKSETCDMIMTWFLREMPERDPQKWNRICLLLPFLTFPPVLRSQKLPAPRSHSRVLQDSNPRWVVFIP